MGKRRNDGLADQIRRAIDASGVTRHRIAKETGIDESALAKFYAGKRGLSLDSLEKLWAFLGLRAVKGFERTAEDFTRE